MVRVRWLTNRSIRLPNLLNPVGSEWSFDAPLFDNPQGMALDGETLYVADAGSHTIQKR